MAESFTALTIEACTGTRSVEDDWAAWQSAPAETLTPRRASRLDDFTKLSPSPECSQAAHALAVGPTWEEAAPRASEVCSPWRPCTLLPQLAQRPTPTANFVVTGRISGSSTWNCSAVRSCSTCPPQFGQHDGSGTSISRSAAPTGAIR